ncbi:MAG: hypothetical protein M3R46_17955, partial [Actinomycetota bacterium]|nr:hypothetical protein [Actinomycetota bacterium]
MAGSLSRARCRGRRGRARETRRRRVEKTGTRSRRELRAQIFYQEFLPGIATRAPLDADGALVIPF